MFERYTEKARRVIFFARYEASQLGSPYIETEHLLLGLMRDEPGLFKRLVPKLDCEAARVQIEKQTRKSQFIAASVDLPLSNESKGVLSDAADEADRLNHRHIGTEHLLLALLREPNTFAAQILKEGEAELDDLRTQIAKHTKSSSDWTPVSAKSGQFRQAEAIELHGARRRVDVVREIVQRLRQTPWYWEKRVWKRRDIVIASKNGAFSFDPSLGQDKENFALVRDGWKRDFCAVCQWALFETTDPAHGEGFTNGRDWLCTECHQKFFEGPDFFHSAYADITRW
jgi:ATP-dependent Clp protease ATP-binding subunit ClpA